MDISLLTNNCFILEKISKELFYKTSQFSFNNFAKAINNKNYLVFLLREDSKIIGYVYYSLVLDEAEIYQIGIIKSEQNKKLGEFLLSNSLAILAKKGIKKVFLDVRSNNIYAIKLYTKEGFKYLYTRKNYYENSVDALVYEKEL